MIKRFKKYGLFLDEGLGNFPSPFPLLAPLSFPLDRSFLPQTTNNPRGCRVGFKRESSLASVYRLYDTYMFHISRYDQRVRKMLMHHEQRGVTAACMQQTMRTNKTHCLVQQLLSNKAYIVSITKSRSKGKLLSKKNQKFISVASYIILRQ